MAVEHAWQHGQFCWTDLATTDHQAASDFYGWKAENTPMPGDGVYPQSGDTAGKMPPSWASYIAVDDVDGATVVVSPTDIADVGRFATLRDPQGASFSVIVIA